MLERNINLKNFLKAIIFFPVIFYFGNRSYIAFDEGFYALQARWMLEKGNWIIPLWWDEYVLDRTIGLQFLIAKSQTIFGENSFSPYIPATLAAIIMLFITFKLHEELFNKKNAIISPLILSTTYLWFDYSHLATQDIIYSCLVTIGIYALLKIKTNSDTFFIFLFGSWIGLAFMMKTFLVAVPVLALSPHIIKTKRYLILNKYFWIGMIIGFIPYLLWAYHINYYLEQNIIFHLFEKFNILTKKNSFTNPFFYYFWNIPITFLPWSVFSLIGIIINFVGNKKESYLLSYFPCFFILMISFFSTKTPYYPLQISALLSLNAYQGIEYLFKSRNYKPFFIFITSKLIPLMGFSCVLIFYFFLKSSLNLSVKENYFLIIGLSLFSLSWALINKKNSLKEVFIFLLIGPYLLTSLLLQSGLFTDRSRELRENMEYLSSQDILKNQVIKVDKSSIKDEQAQSKIIRIALLTPNLGEGIESLESLKESEYAWATISNKEQIEDNAFQIIYENDILYPWSLITKIK